MRCPKEHTPFLPRRRKKEHHLEQEKVSGEGLAQEMRRPALLANNTNYNHAMRQQMNTLSDKPTVPSTRHQYANLLALHMPEEAEQGLQRLLDLE